MSNRREIVIERSYEPDEGACVRAVEFLLKSISKEGGCGAAPDDGTTVKEDSADVIIPEPS